MIKGFFRKIFILCVLFRGILLNASSDSSLLSIQPDFIGLYGMSSFHQLDSRLSNGRAGMLFGAQGRSRYQFTPNAIYCLTLKIHPWRGRFYFSTGIERSKLRTRILFEHPSLSALSVYPKFIHNINRTGLVFGIGSSVLSVNRRGKPLTLEFSIAYVLQFLNSLPNDYMTLDGKKILSDTGYLLIDRSTQNSPKIRVYNRLYNYYDGQNDLNFSFGFKKSISKVQIGLGLNLRLSMRKIGTLYMDYYPGNQIMPSMQTNDITGTGIGFRASVSYPLAK